MLGEKRTQKPPLLAGRTAILTPPNHYNLPFSSRCLLRDFETLLNFDLNILHYIRNPVLIPYPDSEGRKRTYAPAFLIKYRTDIIPAKWMSPLLCEVRCRRDLFQHWRELKPMMLAGRQYARRRKWRFQIITEREVRTPYLVNARFLLPFRKQKTNWNYADRLMDTLYELRFASLEAVLAACAKDSAEGERLLPTLWEMIAKRRVGVDLTQPLAMHSALWPYNV